MKSKDVLHFRCSNHNSQYFIFDKFAQRNCRHPCKYKKREAQNLQCKE